MKTFKIPVVWTMYGHAEVHAENLEEAIDKAMDGGLPPDGSYLEGSFEIDHEGIDEKENI